MHFQGAVVGSGRAGVSELYTRCRLHDDVSEVVGGDVSGLSCGLGEHSVFKALQRGVVSCHAPSRVLRADQAFARMAVSMEVPGFAYLHSEGLPYVRRFENGTALGIRAFGQGFCYIMMIRPRFRMRVARILGPVPRLEDFLVMFRVAGLSRMRVGFVVIAEGVLHCYEGGEEREGKYVADELRGFCELEPGCRVGMQDYGTIGKPTRGQCDKCGCYVKLDGHNERCRVPRVRRPVAELVGDAIHALDVKVAVVSASPLGSHYTEMTKRFVTAAAQKEWMRSHGFVVLDDYASEHSWASEFEIRYNGQFRCNYLHWLARQLNIDPGDLIDRCMMPEQIMVIDGIVGESARGCCDHSEGDVGWWLSIRQALLLVGYCVLLGVLLGLVSSLVGRD